MSGALLPTIVQFSILPPYTPPAFTPFHAAMDCTLLAIRQLRINVEPWAYMPQPAMVALFMSELLILPITWQLTIWELFAKMPAPAAREDTVFACTMQFDSVPPTM